MKKLNKQILYWLIFILYSIINLILVFKHEPWRDEIHAWLMAKELSFSELIIASRFDGHPILWHLLLMPFAKLNFSIITLNLISYIIMLICTWIFLFKTNFSLFFKILVVLTIPFTYTYSAISRNYCLIIFFMMLIYLLYDKRYEKPILYSILISLLIHTHSLAWGLVAGLTITFHFYEIILFILKKSNKNINKIIFGLIIIVINTIVVILELYGTTNTDYTVGKSSFCAFTISIILVILALTFIYTIFNKSNYKEFIILFCGFSFQIIIYLFVYSSVLYQRYILVFSVLLFYLMLISKSNLSKIKSNILCISYLIIIYIFASTYFINAIISDIISPYSSAKEMATYINENLPEDSTILIDASILGQSIIPYLDTAKFYDITNNNYVDCANVSYTPQKTINALKNLDESYSGYYLIVCNNLISLDFDVIYETQDAIKNEKYTLYYINK